MFTPRVLHFVVRRSCNIRRGYPVLVSACCLTPRVLRSLAVIGVAFLIVGGVVLDASAAVVEQTLRYDDLSQCKAALDQSPCASSESPADPLCWRGLNETEKAGYANTCEVTITVEKDMAAPVYFYYEL